jgi:predicted DNA-binding transcriptional regulator AlpA
MNWRNVNSTRIDKKRQKKRCAERYLCAPKASKIARMDDMNEEQAAPRFLTTREVAELLRVKVETVKRWRREGCGPRYIERRRNSVVYEASSIEEFLRSRTRYAKQ